MCFKIFIQNLTITCDHWKLTRYVIASSLSTFFRHCLSSFGSFQLDLNFISRGYLFGLGCEYCPESILQTCLWRNCEYYLYSFNYSHSFKIKPFLQIEHRVCLWKKLLYDRVFFRESKVLTFFFRNSVSCGVRFLTIRCRSAAPTFYTFQFI